MLVKDLIDYIRKKFPEDIQESYDNSGIQVYRADDKLTGVLLALDIHEKVIDDALRFGCNLIITHHPLFFKSIKSVTTESFTGRIINYLIKNNISHYAIHTNLDRVYWNKHAQMLGLLKIGVIDPYLNTGYGYGAYGEFPDELYMEDVLRLVKKTFGNEYLIYTGELDKKIKSVAIMPGSGSSLVEKMTEEKVDLYMCGDIKYHDAFLAEVNGLNLIDISHFSSEIHYMTFLSVDLQDYLTKASVANGIKLFTLANNPLKCFQG
ncbi:MAG TPA: Nif3-like dinuclear metal center hexameric protein [Spirochaetota bacterium]|nr:Nif3-like dinuclear metal center hexameric protein [Spirochaetota bacterium]